MATKTKQIALHIRDTQGQSFWLAKTTCHDGSFKATKAGVRSAVKNAAKRDGYGELHIWRTTDDTSLAEEVWVGVAVDEMYIFLGCHRFRGSSLLALRRWLKKS
jgi:hypothetical protein